MESLSRGAGVLFTDPSADRAREAFAAKPRALTDKLTTVARALTDLGYDGTVALEAWPSGDSHTAMERFRAAFTL
jgi:hydroxypyruvate isomerase